MHSEEDNGEIEGPTVQVVYPSELTTAQEAVVLACPKGYFRKETLRHHSSMPQFPFIKLSRVYRTFMKVFGKEFPHCVRSKFALECFLTIPGRGNGFSLMEKPIKEEESDFVFFDMDD
jgi:hypothetical protein